MRSIHLLTVDKGHPQRAFHYIQVKDGWVNTCNGLTLLHMPAADVFGACINQEDELYFDPREWKAGKFYSAARIEREGNSFKAIDKKGNCTGMTGPQTGKVFMHQFPDITVVIPTTDPEPLVSPFNFNKAMLETLCSVFNVSEKSFRLSYHGLNRGIVIKSTESNAVGLLMMMLTEGL